MIEYYAHVMETVDGEIVVDFAIVCDDFILRYATDKPPVELYGNVRTGFLASLQSIPNFYTEIEFDYDADFEFDFDTQCKIAEAYYKASGKQQARN